MAIPVGVIFGIITMLCWGIADFAAANAVRKASVLKIFFWSQLAGMPLFIVIFLLFFRFPLLSISAIGIIMAASFFGVISFMAFYKGFQVGKISIVSPVASCWPAITVILSLIFLGETLKGFQAVGIVMAILGAVLTSFRWRDLSKLRFGRVSTGINYAAVAMLAWGLEFVFLGFLVKELSWFLPMFFVKTLWVFYLIAYSGTTKQSMSFPGNATLLVFLIGLSESAAYLSYGMGVSSEYTSVVAPVAAVFPVVTIILARIFFKENLDINQRAGVISAIVGIVLLSL